MTMTMSIGKTIAFTTHIRIEIVMIFYKIGQRGRFKRNDVFLERMLFKILLFIWQIFIWILENAWELSQSFSSEKLLHQVCAHFYCFFVLQLLGFIRCFFLIIFHCLINSLRDQLVSQRNFYWKFFIWNVPNGLAPFFSCFYKINNYSTKSKKGTVFGVFGPIIKRKFFWKAKQMCVHIIFDHAVPSKTKILLYELYANIFIHTEQKWNVQASTCKTVTHWQRSCFFVWIYICLYVYVCVRAGNHFTIVYQSHIQAHMA